MKDIFKLIGQFLFLWIVYYLSTLVVETFHLSIPGSVLGMICLFGLLSAGVINEQWLSTAANPLLKHMAFFFIPIAVGLMEWGSLLTQKGYLLFLPLVVSALVSLVTTGRVVQFLTKTDVSKRSE